MPQHEEVPNNSENTMSFDARREKAFLDREISSVEPLVESYTQYYIMLYLYFSSPRCFGVGNSGNAQAIYFYVKLIMSAVGFALGSISLGNR